MTPTKYLTGSFFQKEPKNSQRQMTLYAMIIDNEDPIVGIEGADPHEAFFDKLTRRNIIKHVFYL
jgi:hypothetical protein